MRLGGGDSRNPSSELLTFLLLVRQRFSVALATRRLHLNSISADAMKEPE